MKRLTKIKHDIMNHLAGLVVLFVAIICALFVVYGTTSENGYITLDGKDAQIEEYTEKFIENANDALYRIMYQDQPTDDSVEVENDEPMGQGFYTTITDVLGRRKPDGFNDNGKGLQCSKYTGYLGTGKMEYSSAHPDYGPVNGKDVAAWLVKNYGYKYIEQPIEGAIGSGGFNTLYGHTAMYLYSTGGHTAMVNDANYVPLTVATHNMNIDGWVWVVPGSYNPQPEPTPTPSPNPTPQPDTKPESEPEHEATANCNTVQVQKGDTISSIMLRCTGSVNWNTINIYASHWYSTIARPNQSVYTGWSSQTGVGLYAGDTIEWRE